MQTLYNAKRILKPNTFANFEVPAKIAHRNIFFAISGVVNQIFLTISCLVIIQYQKMTEKIQINLSNDQKKSSDEQFLQAPGNWQKCSALVLTFPALPQFIVASFEVP
jgi:hypothetical protein